jgi:hypothetical protein
MSNSLCVAAFVACVSLGCATGPDVCQEDFATGMKRCQPASGNYGEAAATTAVAAGSWVAVGCKANGCEPPYRCNEESAQCEPVPCGEGGSICPSGTTCDATEKVCR